MKISDLINEIDEKVKNMPLLTKKTVNKYVFFDNYNKPYLATINIDKTNLFQKECSIYSNEKSYTIRVFDKQNDYELVAKSVFTIVYDKKAEVYEKSSVYLSRIELLNKEFAQKGIAKNMLKIIELYANNKKRKEICAYIIPYSFASTNPAGVYLFYDKMGFKDKSTIDKNNNLYTAYKFLEPRKNAELKLSIINYPTKNTQYTLIIPQHLIVASHYQEVEKELL